MPTLPQTDKRVEATVSFRCPPDFKQEVDIACIRLGLSLQRAGIEGLAKRLRIPAPKQNEAAA